MKSLFKRSAIAMAILGFTGASYAAMPQNNATWSPHMNGWFIGVDGLDLRPQNGDMDYVTLSPSTAPTAGTFYTKAVSPSYTWGWRLYGGIKVTDNDDLTLSWMRLNTSDSNSVGLNGVNLAAPRWFDGVSNTWSNVSGKVKYDLNDAYGVWGHTINFNNPWSVRFAAGLEYAKLNSKMFVSANDTVNFDFNQMGYTNKSDMRGFGPRAEFDMTYHLPYGFAVFGNTNAALLVSTRDISLDGYSNNNPDDGYNAYSFNYSNRHVVVPKMGMRLGASYSYVFGQAGGEGCRTTTLTVDAGWQVDSYIHAVERSENGFIANVTPNEAVFARTKVSNFADQGLFLGIKIGSDWM